MSKLHKYFAAACLLLTVLIGCEGNAPEDPPSPTREKDAALLIAPENRRKMPDFTLFSARDGIEVRSENLQGRVALVFFFTPWCSACVADMAMLQNLLGDYDADPFSVIGMAVVTKDSGKLEPFITKLGLKFPILVSDEALQKGFGEITTVPTAFLIDKNGNIARKFVSHLEEDHLTAAIGMLLQEAARPKLLYDVDRR